MKILILTHRIPYPLRDGGALAMHQSIESYWQLGYEVSVLAMNTARHWVEPDSLPPLYQQLHALETVYVNNAINPIAAFFNLFSDKSYHVNRFINKAFDETLKRLLQNNSYDLIQFESLYTSPYLETARQYSQAQCVIRLHNIEHHIWQHLSEHEPNFVKKKYLQLLTARLKQYEERVLKAFDLRLCISAEEQTFLESMGIAPNYYLPFGVSFPDTLPKVEQEAWSCYHLGSMDWAPNVEGMTWFLNEVWQKMRHRLPQAHCYVAGKNMPPAMQKMANEQVHVVGEVDDVVEFSLSKNILVVPLQSGGGIRIKILEAMALGKTIITTSKGADGIPCKNGQHLMFANTAEEFMQALSYCFEHPQEAQRMGENARTWVMQNFDRHLIFSELNVRLHQLITPSWISPY